MIGRINANNAIIVLKTVIEAAIALFFNFVSNVLTVGLSAAANTYDANTKSNIADNFGAKYNIIADNIIKIIVFGLNNFFITYKIYKK